MFAAFLNHKSKLADCGAFPFHFRIENLVQSISHSLLCRWFRAAVLPLDHQLETALYHRLESRRCSECGALFLPGSNRAKYCKDCAARVRRRKEAERQRKRYHDSTHLGAEKAL